MREVHAVVIGGGQAGLATGFYLRRAGLVPGKDFVILDAGHGPGGAWARMWERLRLFSPSQYSSLPGWMMPAWSDGYPPRGHVVDYLTRYEDRYGLGVIRPVRVDAVTREDYTPQGRLLVHTDQVVFRTRNVVSATGTWDRPFWPSYPGRTAFIGHQIHAAQYRRPEDLAGQQVVIVGGGNSAAQILAEVSQVADTTWATIRPPRFLPEHVDGRRLFQVATARNKARLRGESDAEGAGDLGDIVMVPSVRAARERGVLKAHPLFTRLVRDGVSWADSQRQRADTIVWCTGFRPALRHLAALHLRDGHGHIPTSGTRSVAEPRLHLVGYGNWTGFASATLIGVGRTARDTADEIAAAGVAPTHG